MDPGIPAALGLVLFLGLVAGIVRYGVGWLARLRVGRGPAAAPRRTPSFLLDQGLVEAASEELRRAHRAKRPVAILLCNLDNFRNINAVHGHAVGDAVIRAFGEVLAEVGDAGDVLGRLRADEFIFLRHPATARDAKRLAVRIQERLRSMPSLDEKRLECSIGIAITSPVATDWESVLQAADLALLAAKRGGGNRAVVSTEPPRARPAGADGPYPRVA